MTPEEWWKNFALGIELDVSGTFIYNGIRTLDELQSFQHSVDTFEILYNISVGIERLLKIAIVLIEHDANSDMEALEKSLLSHNTMELTNRVDNHVPLNFADLQKEFLSILSKFYKTHRYGRYLLSSVPNIEEEKRDLLVFIDKHLSTSLSKAGAFDYAPNTDQIRKFIGRIIQKIAVSLFDVIDNAATRLNIYTTELRGDSKALRIFYGERLDFIDERIKKKEILLYLMNPATKGSHIDFVRSIPPLELDNTMTANYIQALLRDEALPYVGDEIDELYSEVQDVKERLQLVDLIDNEHMPYDGDDEA